MNCEVFTHENKIGDILVNENLKKYNTYKVGGTASYIVFPKNVDKLIELIGFIKKYNIKYKVIGKGSNIVFSSKNFDGIIIKLDKLNDCEVDDTVIEVGAGYSLSKLAISMTKKGLSGLEFACGIPGTIGGAIFMNAGAYNSDMGYIVESVTVLNNNLEIKKLYNKELNFHYRSSFFQKNKDYVILSAKIILKNGDKKEMLEIIEDRKKRRLMSQPLEFPSAGSVFRNTDIAPSGKLIEDCGLKGYSIGGAMVSEKHANFIINSGDATGEDIYNLIKKIKDEVLKKYNVTLLEEQEFVNME